MNKVGTLAAISFAMLASGCILIMGPQMQTKPPTAAVSEPEFEAAALAKLKNEGKPWSVSNERVVIATDWKMHYYKNRFPEGRSRNIWVGGPKTDDSTKCEYHLYVAYQKSTGGTQYAETTYSWAEFVQPNSYHLLCKDDAK